MKREFEVRIFNLAGEWTDWADANNHEAINEKVFNNNVYVDVISYEYRDGSKIEYRRK